jgi:iron complex outermembrane receptor protein
MSKKSGQKNSRDHQFNRRKCGMAIAIMSAFAGSGAAAQDVQGAATQAVPVTAPLTQEAQPAAVVQEAQAAQPASAVQVAQAGTAAQEGQTASAEPVAPTAPAADPKVQQVVVAGTRKSVASAIDRKLRAGTVSDSIVAEDIGQFPDKNVGEALSRITGVQLSRSFGEGSQVAIRGVEPNLNRVEINGASVLSTSGNGGRGAELRELASELISSIDVYKGITADMTEGGVGGTVSIKTRKPLDFNKFTIASTLSGEQASSRGGVQPRGNLLIAEQFLDGRLGLMANLVYDKVFTREDYARNTTWRFLRDWDFSSEKTVNSTDPAVNAVTSAAACSTTAGLTAAQKTACAKQWYDYSPGTARYGIWTRDHKRSSGELTAQYKVTPNLTAWVSYEANYQNQVLNDRNYGTEFANVSRLANAGTAPVYNESTATASKAGTCVAAPTTSTPDGVVVTNHYVTQYTVGNCVYVAGQGGQGAFSTSARNFTLDILSKYANAGFNYKRDNLEVEGLLVDSKSRYASQSNNVVLTQNVPGLTVTLDSQGLPHFTFPAGYSAEDASSYVQAQLQYRPSQTDNTEKQAKLDFKYRLKTPFFNRIWFGGQSRKATSIQYNGGGYLASSGSNLTSTADDVNVIGANVNQTLVYDPLYTGSTQRAADSQSFINSSYSTTYISAAQMAALVAAVNGRSPGTFFGGYSDVSGLPSSWASPSYAAAAPYFDTSHFNFGNLFSALGSDGKVYSQIPAFNSKEKIQAGYLRLDYESELFGHNVYGNFGARYTKTHNTSYGLFKYSIRNESSPGSSNYTDQVLANTVTSMDNTYHDVLPSFNGAVWLVPDLFQVRVGWAKAMARPSIDQLAPNASCVKNSGLAQFSGDGTDDCTIGNPNLKPYRSTNTDLSFEYYPSRDSQVSAAFFRKKISTYVVDSFTERGVDYFGDGVLYDVTGPVNRSGATTDGVELTGRTALTFLPGFWGGFGIDLNYTRMSYKYSAGSELLNILDGSQLPYPGMSKNSYNAGLWYDQGAFNARLAYTYRDRFYTGANDVSGNPNFQEKTGFLDAKFQYRVNKNVTLSIEGKNLTNETQITDAGDLFRVNELAYPGRRYFVSLSVKN